MKTPIQALKLDLVVFLSVGLSRWPALKSYWCLDDWGQLARSAGILTREPGLPARWLSQDLWWTLTWPVFGLNAVAHTVLRLLLHGLAAVIIARIARQSTGKPQIGLIAGCLFAATPIAFTPLYWASGVQELLAGVLALAAVERWWFGGANRWWLAAGLGAASVLAKESGFGLPFLFTIVLWWRFRSQRLVPHRASWLAIAVLLLVISYESLALSQRFSTGETDPYNTGGLSVILGNIGVFGLWLSTPGPSFAANFTWTSAGYGSLLFVVWSAWGIWCWKRGRPLALIALLGALLSLAPSLVLVTQTHPYLAYVAAGALCLTIAEALPTRLIERKELLTLAVLAIAALGWWNMHARATAMRDGLPADPIVRAITHTRNLAPVIRQQRQKIESVNATSLIIYQPPISTEAVAKATRDGEFAVSVSDRQAALGGTLGPRLILGPGSEVTWRNSLVQAPRSALVLCETSDGLDPWGNTWNALISASMIDVILGHFDRAANQLRLAAQWDRRAELYFLDLAQLRVSRNFLMQRLGAFQVWLGNGPQSGADNTALPEVVAKLMVMTSGS